jgi:predicted GIY-YIG superfamily endonuclease
MSDPVATVQGMTDQYLYRLSGGGEGPLYIGISDDWTRRMRQHWLDKPWAAQITVVELETYRSRAAVLAAERRAIRSERPLYNVQHNNGGAVTEETAGLSAEEIIALIAVGIIAAWLLYELTTAAVSAYRTWKADRGEFLAWRESRAVEPTSELPAAEPPPEPPSLVSAASVPVPSVPANAMPVWATIALVAGMILAGPPKPASRQAAIPIRPASTGM